MSYRDYTKEEQDRIKEMFDFLDKKKEGELTIEEVKLGIIGLGGELNAKEIFQLKNWKKYFTLEDFISICKQKKINVSELENKLLLAFSLLEKDKKGFIPSSSLITILQNDNIPEKEIQKLIKEANPDRDNNIDYMNFVKEMMGANSDNEESKVKNNRNNDDINENINDNGYFNNDKEEDDSDY